MNGPRLKPIVLSGLDDRAAALVEVGDILEQEHIRGSDLPELDWTKASLRRCLVELVGIQDLVLVRGRLLESRLVRPDVTSLQADGSTWRSVEVAGGRIGVMELPVAHWDGVVVTDSRIGYLNLRDSTLSDVSLQGCHIDTLDVTGAALTRVRLLRCTIGELLATRVTVRDLDLRGTSTGRIDGILGLSGAAITADQLIDLAPQLAHACGLVVLPLPD